MEVVIDGQAFNGRKSPRRLILVDGIQYWVRPKQFEVICRLVRLGWASRDQLVDNPNENLAEILYRIKEETPLTPVYDKGSNAYCLKQEESPSVR